MAHLIDKDRIISEIEKIIPSEPYPPTSETLYGAEIYGKREVCFRILDFINTLEVKEISDEDECIIVPRPTDCYSTCKECSWSINNIKKQRGDKL